MDVSPMRPSTCRAQPEAGSGRGAVGRGSACHRGGGAEAVPCVPGRASPLGRLARHALQPVGGLASGPAPLQVAAAGSAPSEPTRTQGPAPRCPDEDRRSTDLLAVAGGRRAMCSCQRASGLDPDGMPNEVPCTWRHDAKRMRDASPVDTPALSSSPNLILTHLVPHRGAGVARSGPSSERRPSHAPRPRPSPKLDTVTNPCPQPVDAGSIKLADTLAALYANLTACDASTHSSSCGMC